AMHRRPIFSLGEEVGGRACPGFRSADGMQLSGAGRSETTVSRGTESPPLTDAIAGEDGGAVESFTFPAQGPRDSPLTYAEPGRDSTADDEERSVGDVSGSARVGLVARAVSLRRPWPSEFEGEAREVSVLMADLRGFTAFCEQVAPRRIWRFLNDYL